jgi:transcriptional regulator with XRE-family HTH domain
MPPKPDLSDAFAQVVARHRQGQKLSKATLAERAGLHQTYIGLLERGHRSPNLDTAKAISGALGIPLADLIGEAERLLKKL